MPLNLDRNTYEPLVEAAIEAFQRDPGYTLDIASAASVILSRRDDRLKKKESEDSDA